VQELCGDDGSRWKEASEWAARALQERIHLWNGVAGISESVSEAACLH